MEHDHDNNNDVVGSRTKVLEALDLHNIMLDAWSKVLPKIATLTASSSSSSEEDSNRQLLQELEQQATTSLWHQVQDLELMVSDKNSSGDEGSINGYLHRSAKFLKANSFTLMIHIYGKCHRVELAWQTWNELVAFLLEPPLLIPRNQA